MRKPPRNSSALYVQRVNLAIDHIVRHLKEPLRLEDVARVACFSPFHFHRIFQAALGETLNQFVRRLRLERAIGYMSHGRKRSLTEIALACGFRSSSDFSRAFKQRFGVPPRDFDLQTFRDQRREDLKAIGGEAMAPYQLDRLPPGTNPDGFEAQLVDLPPRTVAYLRVLDPFRPDVVFAATERLVAWAESRGLADRNWMGYMWEDPDIVALADCRYDVAVEVPHFKPEGEVGRYRFPAMTVAQVEVRGPIDLEQRALDWLFLTWLPDSGYVPDEQPCFEAWIGRPFAHGTEHFELYAQLPVVRS